MKLEVMLDSTKFVGQKKAAVIFDCSEASCKSWRYGYRQPTINQAKKIITDANYVFTGKVIDGYIDGAEIFIDQNFNFNKDEGEYYTNSSSNGEFNIDISDESLAACLQNRPIIADVPVGAIDSTLGEVTKAYRMVLPSISDTGSSAIVISPFTSLLGDAVVQAKSSSSIKDELTLAEGCSDVGNSIASSITSELNQIKKFEQDIVDKIKKDKPEIMDAIQTTGKLDEETEKSLSQIIEIYKKELK